MSSDGNLTRSATSEHAFSTPPPTASNGSMLPPNAKIQKKRSKAWNHFTIVDEIIKKAECNYCDAPIKYNGGTSSMRGGVDVSGGYIKKKHIRVSVGHAFSVSLSLLMPESGIPFCF
jgi:hypothetical protein